MTLIPLTLLSLSLLSLSSASAAPLVEGDRYALELQGFARVLAEAEHVDDPARDDLRAYLFLDQARLGVHGRLDRSMLDVEIALGGEETVIAPYPGVSLGLLDFAFTTPLVAGDGLAVKVGQFRVPYGREEMAEDAQLPFAERSIEHLGFNVGRDVGVALIGRPGPLTVVGGVFTGGGRDVPSSHELPETLGIPLLVGRISVGALDQDPLTFDPGAGRAEAVQGAFAVNGLFTRDSAVGHSTVLNVKFADKSLLLDGGWNPYIGAEPLALGDWWQAGADAAVRAPAGDWTVSGEVEGNVARYTNTLGSVQVLGGRAQAGARKGHVEVDARYALLLPDPVSGVGKAPIQEVTPAVTWHLPGRHLEVLLDVPVVLAAPVFMEEGVGAYVGTDMPGQASLLASGGSVERQTVVTTRLVLQGAF